MIELISLRLRQEDLFHINRHDICRLHLTFVPQQPKLYHNHQSVQAEKPNPEMVPVGGKPCINQANASTSHPTIGHNVSGANSQASNGLVTHSGSCSQA